MLPRLENAVEWLTIRRLGGVPRQWFTRHTVARRQPPAELILDVDSTDAPTHGQQELSIFNGHYDEHMFHPLLVFAEGYLLGARLRPGDVGGASPLRPLLEPIVAHLRGALVATALALHADGTFCNPELLDYAEQRGLRYAIGMPPNPTLDAAVALHRVHA